MAKATPEQRRKANKAAAITVLVVALFACGFMGLLQYLDRVAMSLQEKQVVIPVEDTTPDTPIYVLLIGSDTRKGTALYTGKPTEHAQVDQHSDVMTLVRIDPDAYKVSLLSIPRDTVISEQGEKINNALLENDPTQVVQAVKEVTGLEADYYMLTTFGLFSDLIDAIGGITLDVPQDVTVDDPSTGGDITVKAGKHRKLKGAQALALARARSGYGTDQDAVRQFYVRAIEQAIIEKLLDGDSIGIETLLVVLENDIDTDMDISEIGLLVRDFIKNSDKVTIYSGTGPYSGGVREGDEQWVVEPDAKTWKRVMRRFKAGMDFSMIVEPPEPPESIMEEPSSSSASATSSASSKDGKGNSSGSRSSSKSAQPSSKQSS